MTPWTFGFEEKIDYSGAAAGSSCYEWLGDRRQLGYGEITRKCKTKRTRRAAHIVAFEAAYGAIPEGLKVCHSCDNPGCVRLEHLFLGTQADNIRDCIAKQRFKFLEPRSGERHGMAKVSDSDAEIIRREYRKGVPYYPGNARELAARFGIGTVQVYAIANGQSRRLRIVGPSATLEDLA